MSQTRTRVKTDPFVFFSQQFLFHPSVDPMLRLPFASRTLTATRRWARCNSTKPQYVPDRFQSDLNLSQSNRTQGVAAPETKAVSEEILAAQVIPGRGAQLPYFHPRTHDIPVANIHFRSHHIRLLDLFTHFATHAASALGIPTSKVVYLPTQRSLWTVIRSPFAHKKSQENFERRVHKRAIKAWDADPEVVERWIKYLRLHALGGVGMKVTRWEHLPIGVGQTRYKDVVLELESSSADQIKAMGEKILAEELGSSTKQGTAPAVKA